MNDAMESINYQIFRYKIFKIIFNIMIELFNIQYVAYNRIELYENAASILQNLSSSKLRVGSLFWDFFSIIKPELIMVF